jgi:hypothetical protein
VQGDAVQKQDEEERNNEGEEDEDEEWDPSAETSLKGKREAVVEKNKSDNSAATTPGAQDTGGWQAIWAPSNNGQSLLPVLTTSNSSPAEPCIPSSAYYFWNAQTGAVTWENPLAPKAEGSSSAASAAPVPTPAQQPPPSVPESSWGAAYGAPSTSAAAAYPNAATTAGPTPGDGLPPIDPGLSHLLPRSTLSAAEGYQAAQFNARTGRFTPADFAYTVDHLAEANRARRQEGVFFDVDAWEKQREEEHRAALLAQAEERKRKADELAEGGGGPAKKLTKKDIVSYFQELMMCARAGVNVISVVAMQERFKQKKEEKKARNNAWLRG